MEKNKQQTAVDLLVSAIKEWLVDDHSTDYVFKIPKQMFHHWEIKSKQIEKERIINAYNSYYDKHWSKG